MYSVKPRRAVVVGAGWLTAALVATLAGLGGIRLVGESLTSTPGGVQSEADVRQALAAAVPASPSSPSPAASPSLSAPSSRPPATRLAQQPFSSRGGTAIVECRPGDEAYIRSYSARPGYAIKELDQGPDDDVKLRFEGRDGRVELKIHCQDGVARLEPQHGGDD